MLEVLRYMIDAVVFSFGVCLCMCALFAVISPMLSFCVIMSAYNT